MSLSKRQKLENLALRSILLLRNKVISDHTEKLKQISSSQHVVFQLHSLWEPPYSWEYHQSYSRGQMSRNKKNHTRSWEIAELTKCLLRYACRIPKALISSCDHFPTAGITDWNIAIWQYKGAPKFVLEEIMFWELHPCLLTCNK